jgi:two-component system response regulator YesN
MSAYRLAIVDDEPSIRRGLSLVPWAELGFEVAGLFADGRDAIAYMEGSAVDVVLTDVRMNHVSGIELAEWAFTHRPEVQLVILSGYSEFAYAKAAIRFRVVRYLLKPTNPDELMSAFREIKRSLDERGRLTRIEKLLTEVDEENKSERQTAQELVRHMDDALIEDQWIERIESFLCAPEHAGASIAEIASALNMSVSHLSRAFKQKTGEKFSTYVILHRMIVAKKLLAETADKVQDIGCAVGYWDVRHFIKVFNAHTGMNPSEYRKQARLKGQP